MLRKPSIKGVAKKVLKILIVSSLIAIFISKPQNINAQDFLFLDTFDSSLDQWELHSQWGEWKIVNNELFGSATNYEPIEPSFAIAGSKDWQNYTLQLKLKGVKGVDKAIVFRVNEDGRYYGLNMISPYSGKGNTIGVGKGIKIGGTQGTGLDKDYEAFFENSPGVWYDVRIDVLNDNERVLIDVYINGQKLITTQDSRDPIYSGAIGLFIWPGGAGSPTGDGWLITSTLYDDVRVTPYGLDLPIPTPTPTPSSLNVPDIKQYSPPWNDKEYDTASAWSDNPTIERWGCALTSAAMVLQYHGHQINPDELNNWLNLMPDGYLRNGLLNWLAVSRYTFFNAINGPPILEFRRYNADSTILKNELAEQRPAILKVPGHFAVAKGESNENFLMNDPASDKTLLSEVESDHGGPYSAINSYVSTLTDLSYILFVVDTDIFLKVYDSDGNGIGSLYVDEPLIDDVDKTSTSGESLGIFLLPKPKDGNYRVEATGEGGTYQLDSYLYNEEGQVVTETFAGLMGEGQTDEFEIIIGETNKAEQKVIFASITEDLDTAYEMGLIKNNALYRVLCKLVYYAQKFSDRGYPGYSKKLLALASRYIKTYTPLLIGPQASKILQTNLQILLNSL